MKWLISISMLAISTAVAVPGALAAAPYDSTSAVAELEREAQAALPLVRTRLAKEFLGAAERLPRITPRTVLFDSARTHYWGPRDTASVPREVRDTLMSRTLDEQFYYNTRYGTPLAYVRPLEILANAGFGEVRGRKLLDFGYGTIGHLRLLASLGAEVVGVEVDPLLQVLYAEPGDQGAIAGRGAVKGSVRLVHGQFPADTAVARSVGRGYDLFISKNTLKNGYLHPAEPVDPRRLVHLGVDDTTYVRTLFKILEPGGRALIYNLAPAPAPPGKPYIPWADGRTPFSQALLESAGFRVIAFDRDDSKAARDMGRAFGWDQGESPMNLENDLFATYTLVEKPAKK